MSPISPKRKKLFKRKTQESNDGSDSDAAKLTKHFS
jgi:hypothetical protein